MFMIHTILLYVSALFPILLFILLMVWLDSFTLIKKSYLILSFIWGSVCTLFAILANKLVDDSITSMLMFAPIVEEILKGCGTLWFVRSKRSAFFIDALLYGAAIGGGFAFCENIFYVSLIPDMNIGTALMRGLSTAIMHSGAVACTAAILNWVNIHKKNLFLFFPLALVPAIVLHTFNNSLLLPSYYILPLMFFGVTGLMLALILYNEKGINKWLNYEMDSEVNQLTYMIKGDFSHSKTGEYMLSIKNNFAPEVFFDMFCYVQIYWELSLIAKRNLMLQNEGIDIPKDVTVKEKIVEFWNLRKRIGKTGEIALSPVVQIDRKFYWKLNSLEQQSQ